MRRRTIIGSLAALVLALGAGTACAKVDFSGTWIMDKSKSEGVPPDMDQVMTVTQSDNSIKLETKLMSDQGTATVSDTYTIDGKENDFVPQGPNGPVGKGKRTAKWTEDGSGIEVNEKAEVNTPDGTASVQVSRKWGLSSDGKTLTIELSFNGPNGTVQSKRVFTKK